MQDIDRLVEEKIARLDSSPVGDVWAAHSALAVRLFVVVGSKWARYPELMSTVLEGLQMSLRRHVYPESSPECGALIAALEGFNIEDDGSKEWQYTVDLASTMLDVLSGEEPLVCLRNAIQSYLESSFNIIANAVVESVGHPISQAEVQAVVGDSPEWHAAKSLILAL
jgi:hypothetical protein